MQSVKANATCAPAILTAPSGRLRAGSRLSRRAGRNNEPGFPTGEAIMTMRILGFAFVVALLPVAPCAAADGRFVMENSSLARTVSTEGGILRTVELVNKRAGRTAQLTEAPEFRLRLSQGAHRPGTAYTLTAADFKVVQAIPGAAAWAFRLENSGHGLQLEVRYELAPDDFYLRKRLTITSAKPVTLERIDVEAFSLPEAFLDYINRVRVRPLRLQVQYNSWFDYGGDVHRYA
jgi:hypothetical protein